MENNARYVECCSAGERAGLYYTCVNSYLTPDEAAYILDNSESKVLITSMAKRTVALAAMVQCPRIERCLVVDGPGDSGRVFNLDEAVGGFPSTPIADESLGAAMLYSSGTTEPRGKPGFSTLESGSGRETDSPLEGAGFEPSVPRLRRSSVRCRPQLCSLRRLKPMPVSSLPRSQADMLSAITLKARIRLNFGLGPTSSMVIEMRGPCGERGTAPLSHL